MYLVYKIYQINKINWQYLKIFLSLLRGQTLDNETLKVAYNLDKYNVIIKEFKGDTVVNKEIVNLKYLDIRDYFNKNNEITLTKFKVI